MIPIISLFLIAHFFTYGSAAEDNSSFRLPKSVIPYHYRLEFAPDFYGKPSDFMLSGKTQIYAKVAAQTESITVHAVDLNITGHILVMRANAKDINLFKSFKADKKKQWIVLSLKDKLSPGEDIIIQFNHYTRDIPHKSTGIYYYTRKSPIDGSTQYGITSQMQSIFARHSFPCFDEPGLKATFGVIIYRKESHFSLSNAPLKSSKKYEYLDWYRDEFENTPKMSTYLLTIIITQYKGVSEIAHNVNFTFYYPRTKTPAHVAVAMKVTKEMFPVIQEYFGVKYPMSKLDQIGFSGNDYHLGGMENFGLITYKDFFIYQDLRSPLRYSYIVKLVIHELTHQWFGNLVTMKWWDDLWLNEGITEYYSLLRGKWMAEEYDLLALAQRYVLRAMTLEQKDVSFPVYVSWANSPEASEEMRNDVTYFKGGMVIRMAELLMGENTLRKAMRDYIKRNLYGSVTHQDLWNEFSKANKENGVHLNMSKILTPWITQSGFPVITIKLNYKDNSIDYSQELFAHTVQAVERKIPVPNPYNYTWPVPIQWKTGAMGLSNIEMVYDKSGSIRIPHQLTVDDWLVVNPKAQFYYIVNYEKEHWIRLGRHLEANYLIMDQYTRAKLIYDVLSLYAATMKGKGNFVDADTVNKFLRFAKTETQHLPIAYLKKVLAKGDANLKPTMDIMRSRSSVFKKKKQRKG